MATPNVFQETQERNKQDVNVAVASADAPAYTEERSVPLSVDLAGNVRCVIEGGNIGGTLYDYTTDLKLQDDFSSGSSSSTTIGRLGFSLSGTGSIRDSEANAVGIFRVATGGSSGTVSYLSLTTQGGLPQTSTTNTTLIWRARLNTNDANTTLRMGTIRNINVAPAYGIYFEKADADSNWHCITRENNTETDADSGVAIDTNFHSFKYVRTGTTSATFYIDDVLVATNTTNLPTVVHYPTVQITNSAAADKTIDIDYFQLEYTGMTR